MFDKWEDDIANVILNKNGRDFNKTNAEDLYVANLVLFRLITSYAWQGNEMTNSQFMRSTQDPLFSYISVPEFYEKDSDQKIRDKKSVCFFSNKVSMFRDYYYDEYLDENENLRNNVLLYESPSLDTFEEIKKADIDFSASEYIINELSKDDYYKKLLETNKTNIKKNIDELGHVDFEIISPSNTERITQITNISDHGYSGLLSVFGHFYFNARDLKTDPHIVAKNWLGPIGMIGLYNNSAKGKTNNLFTISFISVTPAFRKMGLGTRLAEEAIKYSIDNNKVLARTDPSKMGKMGLRGSIDNIARSKYPSFPLVPSYSKDAITSLLSNNSIKKLYKNKLFPFVKGAIDHIDNSLRDILKEDTSELESYQLNHKIRGFCDEYLDNYKKNIERKNNTSLEP